MAQAVFVVNLGAGREAEQIWVSDQRKALESSVTNTVGREGVFVGGAAAVAPVVEDTETTDTSITVTWEAIPGIAMSATTIGAYIVNLYVPGAPPTLLQSKTAFAPTVTFTGLDAETEYTVTVTVWYGTTLAATPITVETDPA